MIDSIFSNIIFFKAYVKNEQFGCIFVKDKAMNVSRAGVLSGSTAFYSLIFCLIFYTAEHQMNFY